MDETSRQHLCANAILNDVEQRVHVQGTCSEQNLHTAIVERAPALIIMDIEGAEVELCSTRCIRDASRASWIVECHRDDTVRTLSDRFSATHRVSVVTNEPRSPADISILLPWCCLLLPYDRWRLVDEGRPFPTPWIVATPISTR
jgi:hypothetical protein